MLPVDYPRPVCPWGPVVQPPAPISSENAATFALVRLPCGYPRFSAASRARSSVCFSASTVTHFMAVIRQRPGGDGSYGDMGSRPREAKASISRSISILDVGDTGARSGADDVRHTHAFVRQSFSHDIGGLFLDTISPL